MEYTKFTYGQLFDLAAKNKLILPNFQRDFVWKPDAQAQLLASFLVNLPVGAFLILDGVGGDFVSKELCFVKRNISPSGDCHYLLDGQQRLSTLKNIFTNHLTTDNWEKNFGDLHYQLQYRWFVNIEPMENEEDPFGLKNLRFKIEVENEREQGVIIPKLMTLEPTDVVDSIKYYKIYKTSQKDNFYHPAADLGEGSAYDKNHKLALKCADKSLIPLFDLLSNDKNIIKETLKIIANLRVKSLQETVKNNISTSASYLGHLDSEIVKKYQEYRIDEIDRIWESLKEQWVEDILDYFKDLFKSEIMVPTVKSNELARATSVFEFMNKGGTPLATFDIMVAKFAAVNDDETLYSILHKKLSTGQNIPSSLSDSGPDIPYNPEDFGIYTNDVLIKPIKEQFLNLISLSHVISTETINNVNISNIKKQKILSLKKEAIQAEIDTVTKALFRSLAFLQFRCGMDNFNRLSYKLMILPIALILKDDDKWNNKFVVDKLEFWYWASLFSGRYREKQNQRVIEDIKELNNWIVLGKKGDTITSRMDSVFEDTNYSDEKTLLLKAEDKSVPQAIQNGILTYILSQKPNDFIEEVRKLRAWEISSSNRKLQNHHIIPLGSVTTLGQSSKELRENKSHILNSPLNRTLITNNANNKIKAMDIQKYMPLLNKAVGYSHCILSIPENIRQLNDTDYEQFLKNRFQSIKNTLKRELENLKEG